MKAALLFFGCMVIAETSNALFKLGLNRTPFTPKWGELVPQIATLARNPYILGGAALYPLGFLAWMAVLSRFRYSSANLVYSLHYVLMLAVSVVVFQDRLTPARGFGAALIVAGEAIVGQSR